MKHLRHFVVILLLFIFCGMFVSGAKLTSVEVAVEEITPTVLKICTPNEKYSMEAGGSRMVRLYTRNDMENKTVEVLDLIFRADERLSFSPTPSVITNLTPGGTVKYFDINITAQEDMPNGNYRVDVLLGTEEYYTGALHDEFMIKIRPYSNETYYLFLVISILVLVLLAGRFVWILRVNKQARKPSQDKKKGIIRYYYKKK